jgi:hypothetical protein
VRRCGVSWLCLCVHRPARGGRETGGRCYSIYPGDDVCWFGRQGTRPWGDGTQLGCWAVSDRQTTERAGAHPQLHGFAEAHGLRERRVPRCCLVPNCRRRSCSEAWKISVISSGPMHRTRAGRELSALRNGDAPHTLKCTTYSATSSANGALSLVPRISPTQRTTDPHLGEPVDPLATAVFRSR